VIGVFWKKTTLEAHFSWLDICTVLKLCGWCSDHSD
jgi:hypothetical protein